jgi:hypothetical protein
MESGTRGAASASSRLTDPKPKSTNRVDTIQRPESRIRLILRFTSLMSTPPIKTYLQGFGLNNLWLIRCVEIFTSKRGDYYRLSLLFYYLDGLSYLSPVLTNLA